MTPSCKWPIASLSYVRLRVVPYDTRRGERIIFLSPLRVSPFLAWSDFHARPRFARSTVPEEKWGTTRSLS